MPTNASISVRDLNLDLSNYRTVRQSDEIRAIHAMVSISPDMFWGLMKSLLEDGYLPTENIIVLDDGGNPRSLIVKEGNRRIAIMKLLLGILPLGELNVPADIVTEINKLSTEWKTQYGQVPCSVFSNMEVAIVDRIVARTHGKGEKAGRDRWNAVAKARHKRDATGESDPEFDLLEKYLLHGRNLSVQQKERWAGVYPLTVLDEAMKSVSKRFGAKNAPELAEQYPAIPYRDALEDILLKIGRTEIRFPEVRNKHNDFAVSCGLPPITTPGQPGGNNSRTGTGGAGVGSPSGSTGPSAGSSGAGVAQQTAAGTQFGAAPGTTPGSSGQGGGGATRKGKPPKAVAINDPRTVKRLLKQIQPTGTSRAKMVTLREEARNLNLNDNPIAFCFLLRSMFELSAKAYAHVYGLSVITPKGYNKDLVELLREITNHMTNNMQDRVMMKALHGALTELAKKDGVLSVTSMNQLVHNPSFAITAGDICVLFGNIFPLLDAMNR